ncbi:MAG: hypothetical protein AABY22_00765 [Nanoarchaeota archaeon]
MKKKVSPKNRIIPLIMDNNFLQQTGEGHCFICHTDYIGCTHTCGGSSTVGWCQKCQDLLKKVYKVPQKDWNYCPHCGKEL